MKVRCPGVCGLFSIPVGTGGAVVAVEVGWGAGGERSVGCQLLFDSVMDQAFECLPGSMMGSC